MKARTTIEEGMRLANEIRDLASVVQSKKNAEARCTRPHAGVEETSKDVSVVS